VTEIETTLKELRASLSRRRPRPLGPQDGLEAKHEHQVLASAIHRAVKLIQRNGEGEGASWVRYVETYFPPGRNGRREAKLLWSEWRTPLVKTEAPGKKVKITHGAPVVHWVYNDAGALGIDLESLWDDFEHSVDALITAMRTDRVLRETVLGRWHKQDVKVEFFNPPGMIGGAIAASAAPGATVFSVEPWPPRDDSGA
jgi:hypothetical protein